MPKHRRRSFTPPFKAQAVLEVLTGLKSQAEIARQHGLKPELVARWKDIALEHLETLFQGEPQNGQDQARIAELERMIGRLTMELEVTKKRFYESGEVKRAGADSVSREPRTSPSPSASVDLAHLRPAHGAGSCPPAHIP